jgi:hypothetical protein
MESSFERTVYILMKITKKCKFSIVALFHNGGCPIAIQLFVVESWQGDRRSIGGSFQNKL